MPRTAGSIVSDVSVMFTGATSINVTSSLVCLDFLIMNGELSLMYHCDYQRKRADALNGRSQPCKAKLASPDTLQSRSSNSPLPRLLRTASDVNMPPVKLRPMSELVVLLPSTLIPHWAFSSLADSCSLRDSQRPRGSSSNSSSSPLISLRDSRVSHLLSWPTNLAR